MCHNMTSPAWASVKLNITLLSAAKRIYLGTKSSISSRTCWVMFYKFKMRSCQRWSLLNWLIKHCTLHNNREQKLKHKLLRINWGTPPLFFLLKATKHKAIKQSSCRPPSFFFFVPTSELWRKLRLNPNDKWELYGCSHRRLSVQGHTGRIFQGNRPKLLHGVG